MPRLLRILTVLIFLVAISSSVAQQRTVTLDSSDWASILDQQDADQDDRWESTADLPIYFLDTGSLRESLSIAESTATFALPATVVAIIQNNQASTVLQL